MASPHSMESDSASALRAPQDVVAATVSRKGVSIGVAEKMENLAAPQGLGFGPECALGLRVLDRILKRLLYTNPGPPLFAAGNRRAH